MSTSILAGPIAQALCERNVILTMRSSPSFPQHGSEYVPDGVTDILAKRWSQLLDGTGAFSATILKDANHRADGPVAMEHLLRVVNEYLTTPN